MKICSTCGFEEREGETHRVMKVVEGTPEDPHVISWTGTLPRDTYTMRFGAAQTLKAPERISWTPCEYWYRRPLASLAESDMPTICLQCSMKALLAGQQPPTFDEEPDVHQKRVHPDLEETLRERRPLELQLAAKLQNEH